MRRFTPIIAAALVVAACAAEDPPLAQSPTTTTSPVAETTEPAATSTHATHDADAEHEGEHGDESPQEASNAHEDPPIEGRMIEVTMSEFAFEPTSIEVSAGETVTFMIENVGLIEHEFRLSNAHRIDEHIASGHAGHDDEQEGHHEDDGDVIVLVAAGDAAQLTFQFPEDTTVYTHVACLIPGHYEAGMVAELTAG